MTLGSISLKPSLWLRYVDDTFIVWLHQEDIQILLYHVNSIQSCIQFTMEKEQDNRLSFLDVLINYMEQRFMSFVYRKPTFTGQYLNFNSHYSYNVKKGIIRYFQHWAKAISSDRDVYQEEIKSLRDNLRCNIYSESIITSAPRNLDWTRENDSWKLTTVCLSNVKSLAPPKLKNLPSIWYQDSIHQLHDSLEMSRNTWPRIVCTPSQAVMIEYSKVRQTTH